MTLSDDRIAKIHQKLAVLKPVSVQIDDESAAHAGHAGAATGAGHFRVTVIAQNFHGLKLIERHRLVYDAVGDLMRTDIHALVISAWAPDEVPQQL